MSLQGLPGQVLLVMRHCGAYDPEDAEAYAGRGGFEALRRLRAGTSPSEVIDQITGSGLRGRGGGGFPAGAKWQQTAAAPGGGKYVIGNASEGEVGAFKDRYLLENDPFSFIEGLAIAAYAVGAARALVQLRGEYGHLAPWLAGCIARVREQGWLELGAHPVDISLRRGSGGYVCGEETAMMECLEGRRGEPRDRPPFPPSRGLGGFPTLINNVETLMNVPWIVVNGADRFRAMGTPRSPGTKVFSVSGDVARPGVYEMEMGRPLRDLLGMAGAQDIKMVQLGGASGRIVPAGGIDVPLSYETVLGAGPVMVFDRSRDVVEIMRQDMEFAASESCGKCTPCREGTRAMADTLARIAAGAGQPRDLEALGELSAAMMLASSCGLGQAAGIPVMDSLEHFRADYEAEMVP